jgi:hypothetical protein
VELDVVAVGDIVQDGMLRLTELQPMVNGGDDDDDIDDDAILEEFADVILKFCNSLD